MEDHKGIHLAIKGNNSGNIAIGSNITQSNQVSEESAFTRATPIMTLESSVLASGGSDLEQQQRLFQILSGTFNNGELRDLCFELGIEYDDLLGETRRDKARELVAFARRRDRLAELERAILRARPKAFGAS